MSKLDEVIKLAVANLGEEELEQLRHTVLTRADTQAEADALFGQSPAAREAERRKTDALFVQGKVARKPTSSSIAPDVLNVPGPTKPSPDLATVAAALNKTAAIDAFIEKTAGVYMRYPELMKVATPTPKVVSKPKNSPPVQSALSGGAA